MVTGKVPDPPPPPTHTHTHTHILRRPAPAPYFPPPLVINFDFLDINRYCVWDKFILGTSEQTAKILKTGFAKIGHTTTSKPQWVGF